MNNMYRQKKYLSKHNPDAWILIWLAFPLAFFGFVTLFILLAYAWEIILVLLLTCCVGVWYSDYDKKEKEREEALRILEEQRIEAQRIEAEKANAPKRRYNREEKDVPINQVHKRIGVQNHAKKRDNRKRWRYNR